MRDVKLVFSMGWRKSRIEKAREPGFYNDCTVSLITNVPDEVSDSELIERWDAVDVSNGKLIYRFNYYALLDAETTAKEDYRVAEHNKGRF